MRIVIVCGLLPYPLTTGGHVGTFQTIRGLSKNHEITMLCLPSSPDSQKHAAELGKLWPNVEVIPYAGPQASTPVRDWVGHSKPWRLFQRAKGLLLPDTFLVGRPALRELKQRLFNAIRGGDIDLLQVDFPWMMGFVLDIPLSIPSIYVCHEIQFVRALREAQSAEGTIQRWRRWKTHYCFKRQELALARKYHAIITMTEVDKRILQGAVPNLPIFVSPSGIDTVYYEPTGQPRAPTKVTFMGNWVHSPNVDGLRFFFERIFPIIKKEKPDIPVFILGDYSGIDTRALSSDSSVIWTGFVEDPRPYLEGSAFIAPLRIGSGLRMKILEAMSMKCPVVSTSVGCEGIPARDGKDIFVEDNPHNFASRILYLMENPRQALDVGRNARELVVSEYNWEKVAARRDEVYRLVLSLNPPQR